MKQREASLSHIEATRSADRRPQLGSSGEDVRDEQRRRPLAPSPAPASLTVAAPQPRRALAGLLSSREALRMAFVAREILGPPKALQRPEDDMLP